MTGGLDDEGWYTADRPAPRFDLGPPDEPVDEPEGREPRLVKRACGCMGAPDGGQCVHDTERLYDVRAFSDAFEAWAKANPGYGVSWYSGPPAPRLEDFRCSQAGAA